MTSEPCSMNDPVAPAGTRPAPRCFYTTAAFAGCHRGGLRRSVARNGPVKRFATHLCTPINLLRSMYVFLARQCRMVLLEHVPMRSGFPSFSTLVPTTETLLIAAVGAIAFLLIGFPAGLVTGSMLAVTVGALLGRPMKIPLPLARVCFVITGPVLGRGGTP